MDNPDPWAIYLNQYMKRSGHGHTFDIPGLESMGIENQTITGCLRNDDWVYMYGGKEGICTQLQKPPHAGLFVTKVSKASPKLFLACATGQHIKEAALVGVKEGKDRQEFFKVTLTDVLVSSFQQSA